MINLTLRTDTEPKDPEGHFFVVITAISGQFILKESSSAFGNKFNLIPLDAQSSGRLELLLMYQTASELPLTIASGTLRLESMRNLNDKHRHYSFEMFDNITKGFLQDSVDNSL